MKKLICAVLAAAVLSAPSAMGAEGTNSAQVFVDGERIDLAGRSYGMGNDVFVPMREICDALGAESVSWYAPTETALVTAPGLRLEAQLGRRYIEANGRCIYTDRAAHLDISTTMVSARAICFAFGASAVYAPDERTLHITSGTQPIASVDARYDAEDVEWLSRIIHGEAEGECLEGKIAVGNVVLNRVESKKFPNTVRGVIFDRKYGVQFAAAWNGRIDRTPSEESVAAAKMALEGTDMVGDCLYFSSYSPDSWMTRCCTLVTQIENHCFYI